MAEVGFLPRDFKQKGKRRDEREREEVVLTAADGGAKRAEISP